MHYHLPVWSANWQAGAGAPFVAVNSDSDWNIPASSVKILTAAENNTMPDTVQYLSKREQQIMEIIYQRGEATVVEVIEALPDRLSNSAVRTFLRILERKGHLRHVDRDSRYVYLATRPRQSAARTALTQVLNVFFGGSVEQAMATLLSEKEGQLSGEELDRLQRLIADAKRDGR